MHNTEINIQKINNQIHELKGIEKRETNQSLKLVQEVEKNLQEQITTAQKKIEYVIEEDIKKIDQSQQKLEDRLNTKITEKLDIVRYEDNIKKTDNALVELADEIKQVKENNILQNTQLVNEFNDKLQKVEEINTTQSKQVKNILQKQNEDNLKNDIPVPLTLYGYREIKWQPDIKVAHSVLAYGLYHKCTPNGIIYYI